VKATLEELLAKAKKPAADAMWLHPFYVGKVQVMPKCAVRDFQDLAIWYTPGVAAPCRDIHAHPEKVWEHTNRGNTIAVVSDGARVLGPGDIGPEAGLPVMEGKALLFKYLGGVDAVPIVLRTRDPDVLIETVKGGRLMREITCQEIADTVARLCIEANYHLGEDVLDALKSAREKEISTVGQAVLGQILQNAAIAARGELPLCQDTGLTVVFLELGQDVHVVNGDLNAAINEGVRQGYQEGYLRKSVVRQPFSARVNTKDNTPAVIHAEIVPGDKLKITVVPKGGGSENMSYLKTFSPAAGRQGIVDWVVECVDRSAANPCPPIIVGVGIGGTIDQSTLIAKKALLRPVGHPHPDPEVAELEAEILERVNKLGIGPQGFGGRMTALAVHAETFPCHIASMPAAVNIQCHSARHKEAVL
jgi:fumarate hydratase subunit alpha